MPSIDASLIPLVSPGSLFPTLVTNTTLSVRWLGPKDPHYFDTYNRPMADIVLRQLILAKSLDQLGLTLTARVNFPFLNNPTVNVATNAIQLPSAWVWDMHVSLNNNYEKVRLSRLIRFEGSSDATNGEFSGVIRFVFSGNIINSNNEVGLFYVDYQIDNNLTYQIRMARPATVQEHPNPIPSSEAPSVAGFVVFRTLDVLDNTEFLNYIAPPADITGVTSVAPIIYEISDSLPASGNQGEFSFDSLIHGTGLLVPSAYNSIPETNATKETILTALNFPWIRDANLNSNDNNTTIPPLIFDQFIMTAPMGDRSDTLQLNFPVYLTKIRRLDVNSDSLELTFSTTNTIIGNSSNTLIEFATTIIERTAIPGTLVEIIPANNLRSLQDSTSKMFGQNFGSGYAVLSNKWQSDPSIDEFFDSFLNIINEPPDIFFNSRLSEFALHRTPINIPTIGEAQALTGSTSRRSVPIHPSDDNRYITEFDQGLGDQVDFRTITGFQVSPDIDPVAYRGSLLSRSFILKVNTSNQAGYDYENDILPRIIHLLGRKPIHADEWFDGTTFKRYDQLSDAWIG